MDKMLSRKGLILLFIGPGIAFYAMFYLAPILFTAFLSGTGWDGLSLGTLSPVWLGNYVTLALEDPVFWTGIKNTLIILAVQVAVQVPITLVLALVLDACASGAKIYKTAFFVPVLFSATAVGLLWSRVYSADYGLVNQLFDALGLERQTWLSSGKTAIYALAVPMVWRSIGYYLIILYAGIKSIPRDYYEAALIDGCDGPLAAVKITIPLLRNALAVVTSLTAVAALREYPLIYVMTNGGPYNSTSTPAIQMYVESFLKMQFGYGSAISVALVVECLAVAWLVRRLLPEKDIQY